MFIKQYKIKSANNGTANFINIKVCISTLIINYF